MTHDPKFAFLVHYQQLKPHQRIREVAIFLLQCASLYMHLSPLPSQNVPHLGENGFLMLLLSTARRNVASG